MEGLYLGLLAVVFRGVAHDLVHDGLLAHGEQGGLPGQIVCMERHLRFVEQLSEGMYLWLLRKYLLAVLLHGIAHDLVHNGLLVHGGQGGLPGRLAPILVILQRHAC